MHSPVPCVVFVFNRADNLARMLAELRTQNIDELIVCIDGPRDERDDAAVKACIETAESVDWIDRKVSANTENRGFLAMLERMGDVFDKHESAVFLEDDCMPVPGFYAFMKKSLAHYRDEQRVFSIAGYQPVTRDEMGRQRHSFVSSYRFGCWGWGSWSDRWRTVSPLISEYDTLFDNLADIPDVAGRDIADAAIACAIGRQRTWDIKVALAALSLKLVHLSPVGGLIRNIGVNSGAHGARSDRREQRLHNRNVAECAPLEIKWLEDVQPDTDYSRALLNFVSDVTRGWSRWKKTRRALEMNVRKKACTFLKTSFPSAWSILRNSFASSAQAPPARFYDLVLAGRDRDLRKRALLSYITRPFTIQRDDPIYMQHANIWLAHAIVKSLNLAGLSVDAVDCDDRCFEPRRTYDVFVSHGGNAASIMSHLGPGTRRLHFATGCYWRKNNEFEEARFSDLAARKGVSLPRDRFLDASVGGEESLRLVDGIAVLGNRFTADTYAQFGPTFTLDGIALPDDHFDPARKDFASARNNFLYFAGSGCVHKGLDLLLEAFAGSRQCLWIFSYLEDGFATLYEHELRHSPNIHYLGWIQPRCAKFYDVIDRCQYVILPSCSEGQAQSVVECMNQGLVPIVSAAAGIDADGFGITLDSCAVDAIRRTVDTAASLSAETCRGNAVAARQTAVTRFSEDEFVRRFTEIVREVTSPTRERRDPGHLPCKA